MLGHTSPKILSLTDITFIVRQINDGVNDSVLIAILDSLFPRKDADEPVDIRVVREMLDECIAASL